MERDLSRPFSILAAYTRAWAWTRAAARLDAPLLRRLAAGAARKHNSQCCGAANCTPPCARTETNRTEPKEQSHYQRNQNGKNKEDPRFQTRRTHSNHNRLKRNWSHRSATPRTNRSIKNFAKLWSKTCESKIRKYPQQYVEDTRKLGSPFQSESSQSLIRKSQRK